MAGDTQADYFCHGDRETYEKAQRLFGEDEAKRKKVVRDIWNWFRENEHLRGKEGKL